MVDNNNDLPISGNQDNENDRIIKVNIEEQMKSAYIDYSMSVIVGRALPDVRDGMKPVHRRILYAMNELGMTHNRAYKKSARVVGEVLGKYHPHGDSSVYDAMVRMAQPWSMRYMLVDGQGNFGSQDGDGPAAMRYTEARLRRLAESMLVDIEKNTVDFVPNFDESLKEPSVLPTRIPSLLVNGSSGIAVGMATNMMPHNLSEVVDGCIAYIDNRDITVLELMKHIKAPDFPTGAIVYGIDGIRQAYETGKGRVVLRGRVEIETLKSGKEQIVITEVPYQVSRDALTEKIGMLVNSKVIENVTHVANESNKNGTRIVVELKMGTVSQIIVNQLYKHTELQTSFGINNVALVNGRPRILNLKELIHEFVDFRHEIVIRRTNFELDEAKRRSHILEGYMKVINTKADLDRAIAIIRESATPDAAREELIAVFDLSEIQAKAILELRLRSLTGLEIDKIRSEYEELQKKIAHLQSILDNEYMRFDIIKQELLEVKNTFGDKRLSEIEYSIEDLNYEDFIEEEDMVITISNLGYIKRTSVSDYRLQKRGGRGAIGGKTRDEDYIEHLFVASTHTTLLFFTEKGRLYWLKVYEIPEFEKNSKGRAIQNLIQIPSDDNIRTVKDIRKLEDESFINSHYIVLCTQNGIIKKTLLKSFSNTRKNGVNAITIQDGDRLLDVSLTDGKSYIMMAVRSGRAICFHEDKVRPTGRGAIGVNGIVLDDEFDAVVGMICINKNDIEKNILVVSEKGLGKRTAFFEPLPEDADNESKSKAHKIELTDGTTQLFDTSYRITNRGGKGVKTINITQKTGALVGLLGVETTNDLMITCKSGITIRMHVKDIRETGRNAQGVRLINLDEDDEIAAIAKIQDQENDTDETSETEEGLQSENNATNSSNDDTSSNQSDIDDNNNNNDDNDEIIDDHQPES